MARALVLQFIAGYSSAPASIALDLDHTADITHGQQELSFYNHHYGNYCYLPLLAFAGAAASHLLPHRTLSRTVSEVRLFGEFEYAAKPWSQAHRVVLKAEALEALAGTGGAPDKDKTRTTSGLS